MYIWFEPQLSGILVVKKLLTTHFSIMRYDWKSEVHFTSLNVDNFLWIRINFVQLRAYFHLYSNGTAVSSPWCVSRIRWMVNNIYSGIYAPKFGKLSPKLHFCHFSCVKIFVHSAMTTSMYMEGLIDCWLLIWVEDTVSNTYILFSLISGSSAVSIYVRDWGLNKSKYSSKGVRLNFFKAMSINTIHWNQIRTDTF